MRPLGIPIFTDKPVQEALRMILESVYEPIFLDCSHGFRPNKSCHTALKDLKHQFHGTRWGIPYETKAGIKRCYFAKYSDAKKVTNPSDRKTNAAVVFAYSVNTFEKRLKAKVCELCGTNDSNCYEIHHINKVKNLKGKETWERVMIAKRRKIIAVCKACHNKIHHN